MSDNVIFSHGSPVMLDHTAGESAIEAGDVVVVGEDTRIAHKDIAANTLGALGGGYGVYDAPKEAGSGEAISAGVRVYWDADNSVATTTASTHKKLGRTVQAASDADTTVRFVHEPGTDDS
jgi:predicted RecA/RadA family phage recombinase